MTRLAKKFFDFLLVTLQFKYNFNDSGTDLNTNAAHIVNLNTLRYYGGQLYIYLYIYIVVSVQAGLQVLSKRIKDGMKALYTTYLA